MNWMLFVTISMFGWTIAYTLWVKFKYTVEVNRLIENLKESENALRETIEFIKRDLKLKSTLEAQTTPRESPEERRERMRRLAGLT